MRILLLSHAFNSLTQRLGAELRQRGHLVSVEFDISDSVTEEAAALFAPDLIVAPYLRRAVPESVWSRHVCLIVHPGVVGDRRPSALDWAVMHNRQPLTAQGAQALGLTDACLPGDVSAFHAELAAYRNEEIAHMHRNFYGFDPSYHVARHHFVHKSLTSWTPRHLARHRELGWKLA
ncbi:hypothetical protein [Rhodoferax sp.]|uniref:hypothetical protein n=1 Tax=Rhodoferax sp. TaxID=50421 RepID=UPI0035263532